MADVTVTGLTKDRMITMENNTVIDGNIVGNNLHLITRGGATIDAGNVRGPTGATGAAGSGHIICTSTTRPALVAADEGKTIYEKDTDLVKTWTGSRWKLEDHILCTSATRPAVVLADEGVVIRESDTNLEYTWSGSRWMIQPRIICTSSTRPTGLTTGDEGVQIYETDTNLEYTWVGATWAMSSGLRGCLAWDEMLLTFPANSETNGVVCSNAMVVAPIVGRTYRVFANASIYHAGDQQRANLFIYRNNVMVAKAAGRINIDLCPITITYVEKAVSTANITYQIRVGGNAGGNIGGSANQAFAYVEEIGYI